MRVANCVWFAPFGDDACGGDVPRVTLASLAHPRLSMVRPLRGREMTHRMRQKPNSQITEPDTIKNKTQCEDGGNLTAG